MTRAATPPIDWRSGRPLEWGHDDAGRQYEDGKLVCDGCGGTAGHTLTDEEDQPIRAARVTTDRHGNTYCRVCRHEAYMLGEPA